MKEEDASRINAAFNTTNKEVRELKTELVTTQKQLQSQQEQIARLEKQVQKLLIAVHSGGPTSGN